MERTVKDNVKRLELAGISRATELLVPAEVLRTASFSDAAQEMLRLFVEWPALETLRLTGVCSVAVTPASSDLRACHAFKLVGVGAPVALYGADASAWALEHLPYESMGSGTFELHRNSDVVRRFLCESDCSEERIFGLISEVAAALASSFEVLSVSHDFDGL
jgi:hypothetical protein